MLPTTLNINLPEWLQHEITNVPVLTSTEARMQWVIGLSEKTLQHQDGGPFACAIFDDEQQLVAAGVNLVTSHNNPTLHAETTAIAFAHAHLQTYYFDQQAEQRFHLYTSTEPCVMCLGACLWSGVASVVCAARDEDARAIGFDEGPKPNDWQQALRTRGVAVMVDVCRAAAVAVLQRYQTEVGVLYGPS